MTHENNNDDHVEAPVPAETGSITTTREQVREKADQVKARLKRNRLIQLGVIGVVLIAIIVTIAIMVTSTVSGVVNKPQVDPAGLDKGGIRVSAQGTALPSSVATPSADPSATPTPSVTRTAAPTNPVQIDIYLDYLSPDAAVFQKANAQQLARLIGDEAITVTYHPVATMTAKSNGTKYSLRAAGAAACVASYAPNFFFAYTYELLAQQPGADTDGLTDDQLADVAIDLGTGSDGSLRNCISNGTYLPWVKTATETATSENLPNFDAKLTEIPTVLVNGTAYIGALDDPAEFMQFIMAAESKAYYTTPSPTPSATPTDTPSATPDATETPAAG